MAPGQRTAARHRAERPRRLTARASAVPLAAALAVTAVTGAAVAGFGEPAATVARPVAAFPEVTAYGGLRPGDDGEHGQGLALDIMVVSSEAGDQIAEFVRSNSGDLGVSEVLWAQQIWTMERSNEGWRALEDRGSATANHYDHVHVTVYG